MNKIDKKRIKVLFDYQVFVMQNYGGISRYFSELMKQFNNDKEIDYYLPISFSSNSYLDKRSLSIFNSLISDLKFRGKSRITGYINNKKAVKCISSGDFDIFHPTYYDTYFLKHIKDKPFVLTVYDMIHEKFPNIFPKNDPTIKFKKDLINRASRIIAISKHTKKDIVNIYKINPKKIDVVYLASSFTENFEYEMKGAINLPRKYILFVGDRHSYKNFTFFVESIGSLLLEDKNLFLICAGSKDFTEEESSLFSDLNIKEKIIHKDIENDEMLVYFYKNAEVFVFPSLYEGFGIPVLESLSCGCPTVLSNSSSLPEVGGLAALYFNPNNKNSIQSTVRKVLTNGKIKKDLVNKGFEQINKFSWHKTAEETLEIYKKVLNHE